VLAALQRTALTYLYGQAGTEIPFWKMVGTPLTALEERALAAVEAIVAVHPSARVERTEALPGAGSAPGVTMPSVGVVIDEDLLEQLRRHNTPVIARSRNERTLLDFRSVDPVDDVTIVAALRGGV
jgi:L-seryl-tRNA(Ser) seleniumtransferase